MKKLLLILFILLEVIGKSQTTVKHQFHGTIIRSSTVENNKALIGMKGKGPETGLVYYSKNILKGWTPCNNGQALSQKVEDVQAVAFVNDSTFLAGTWKNGLFISSDTGKTWSNVTSFPAKDIRSFSISNSTPKTVYAATTTNGILQSLDLGNTWKQCSDSSFFKQTAAWSLEIDPKDDNILYALSFRNGIQKSSDKGQTWKEILLHDGMMIYDLVISKQNANKLWAIGGNDSLGVLYRSIDKGDNWEIMTELPKGSLNQVSITGPNEDVIVIGSWNKGVFIYSDGKWGHLDEVKFETIANIETTEKEVIIFSWGDGIFKIPNNWVK